MVELLVTIAIIGIIAVFVIPNFLDSLNKAKQKRTMANVHEVGKAMMSWLTAQMGAGAAGSLTVDLSTYGTEVDPLEMSSLLVPEYIAHVPEYDAWGYPLEYFLRTDDLLAGRVMLIRSPGFDGAFSADSYSISPFVTTDFDQDIVWADGIFIRWPVGVSTANP